MKKLGKTRITAIFLCIMLIAATAVSLYSCEKTEGEVLGKGKVSFKLEITNDKGETKIYTIKTDEKTVGDALVKAGLTSDSGYITTLDKLTAVWDDTQQFYFYWGFYINGEFASVGAFDGEIDKEAVYSFKYEDGSVFDDEAVG